MRPWSVLGLLALSACYTKVPVDMYEGDQEEIDGRLDALEGETVAALAARLEALETENAALQARVQALEGASPAGCAGGCVGQDDIADVVRAAELAAIDGRVDALEGDHVGVAEVGRLDGRVDGVATELAAGVASLDGRLGPLETGLADHAVRLGALEAAPGGCVDCVSRAELSGYTTVEVADGLEERLGAVEGGYLTAADLVPYAEDADLVALTTGLTEHSGQLDAHAGRLTALEAQPVSCPGGCVGREELAGYVTTDVVADMATQAWVEARGYATEGYADAGDLAVRGWVSGEGYLTESALAPYALVSYVDAGDAAERAWVEGYAASLYTLSGRVDRLEGDQLTAADLAPYATQTWVAAGYPEQVEVDGLGMEVAGLAAELDGLAVDLVAVASDYVTHPEIAGFLTDAALGDVVRLYDPAGHPERDAAMVRVPTDFPDVQAALDSLAGLRLVSPVEVVVEPAHCGHVYSQAIVVNHPDGEMITLRSEALDADACALQFEGGADGVVVAEGRALGLLRGVELSCVDGSCGQGVFLTDGASAEASDLRVSGFGGDGVHLEHGARMNTSMLVSSNNGGYGVSAGYGATFVDAAGEEGEGVIAHDNTTGGVYAGLNAVLVARYVHVVGGVVGVNVEGGLAIVNHARVERVAGHGISATNSSLVEATDSTIEDVGTITDGSTCGAAEGEFEGAGVWASGGSVVNVVESRISRAAGAGIVSYIGAYVVADFANISETLGGDGMYANLGAAIRAWDATSNDNCGHGFFSQGGSSMYLHGGEARRNGKNGIQSVSGFLEVGQTTSANNGGNGIDLSVGAVAAAEAGFTADNNAGWGAMVEDSSVLRALTGRIRGNDLGGVYATGMSWVNAAGATVTGNADPALEASYDAAINAEGATLTGDVWPPTSPLETTPSTSSWVWMD